MPSTLVNSKLAGTVKHSELSGLQISENMLKMPVLFIQYLEEVVSLLASAEREAWQ